MFRVRKIGATWDESLAVWIQSRLRSGGDSYHDSNKIEDRIGRIEILLGNLVELLASKGAITSQEAVSLIDGCVPCDIKISEVAEEQ